MIFGKEKGMSENKKNDQLDNTTDLKYADAEKKSENSGSVMGADILGSRVSDMLSANKSKVNARKKLPVAADIIIAVLMIAILAGAVIGAYALFRYNTNNYDNVQVEYCIATPYEKDITLYRGLINSELYCDENGNTFYVGKVVSVELSTNQSSVIIIVDCNAKYRPAEGYLAGDCKIAVGEHHLFRSQVMSVDGTIVEMYEKNETGKGGN
jgi:hypothetical protein